MNSDKIRYFLTAALLAAVCVLAACGGPRSGPEISEEVVAKYLRAWREIRRKFPEMNARGLSFLNFSFRGEIGGNLNSGGNREDIARIVRSAGFRDLGEFVKINLKISSVLHSFRSHKFISQIEKANADNDKRMEKILADPNLPEKTREGIRRGRELARQAYRDNARRVQKVTGEMRTNLDKKSLENISRYREELIEVLTPIRKAADSPRIKSK